MKRRYYQFPQEKNNIKLIATTKALETIKKYGSFDIPISIIKDKYKSEKIFVDIIGEQYSENNVTYTFLVDDGKNKIIVKLNGEIISIQNGHIYEEYITYITMDGNGANLIKQEDIYNDRKIVLTYPYKDQYMTIEIIFNDKKFIFKTKYDVNNKYDTQNLRFLNYKSTIVDLKEYYKRNFYIDQSDWERKCETCISIYKKKDFQFLLSDKIIIENGEIVKYTINSIQNNIILSLTGGKNINEIISIENYNPISNIDIKKDIDELIIRGRSLK